MTKAEFANYFGTYTAWSGYCLDVALLAIASWVLYGFKKHRMDDATQNKVLIGAALSLLAGLSCAFLFDAFFTGDWRTWCRLPEKRFGFTFAGGLIGFLLALSLWGHFSGIGGRFLLNFFLPSMALAQAIGRICCFIGGCCYGCESDFGVEYPPGSFPYSLLGSVKLFPVQLVESGCLFLLFFICLITEFFSRAAVYLIGVGLIRFWLEFFRGDVRGDMFGIEIFSPQQILSILFIVIGVILLYRKSRYTKPGRFSLDGTIG